MCNTDIKAKAKENGVKLWEIAEHLGLIDSNFSRKLRHELPQHEKEEIFTIIERLSNRPKA